MIGGMVSSPVEVQGQLSGAGRQSVSPKAAADPVMAATLKSV